MFPFRFFYKSRSKQSQRVPAATLRSPSAWQFLPIPSSMNLTAAEDFCRVVASQHYENFTVATRLVPRRLRQHLANVYAFARWSDDLADELASPEESRQALADWRAQLESCFDGRPTHPLFVALADTAQNTRPQSTDRITSNGPVVGVLELGAGFARRWHVEPGSRLLLF